MKRLLFIVALFTSLYSTAQITPYFPPRTPVSGQSSRVIQDNDLRARFSFWMPKTPGSIPVIRTIDSAGSNVQFLEGSRRIAVSRGLGLGFDEYINVTEVDSKITTGITGNTNILNQTSTLQAASYRLSGTGQLAKVGIGAGASGSVNFDNRANITGSATSYAELTQAAVQSGVTSVAYGKRFVISTAAAAFTLPNLYILSVSGGTTGAGSTLPAQTAFNVESNFTNATANYAYRSNISGAGNYANYHQGSSQNYFQGNTTFGTSSDSGDKVYVVGAVRATQFKVSALNTAPASSTDTGQLGEIRIDANFIYICVASNTWKRSAISTW
jgi:hypothetical protein